MEVKFRKTQFGMAAGPAASELEPLSIVADRWARVHPTPETVDFREMLMGLFGYTEGQGVYNVVRSGDAAIQQLHATICTLLLNAASYRDLEDDWREHVEARRLDPKALARRYPSAATSDGVAGRVFDTWQRTLQTTLRDFARGVLDCFAIDGPGCTISFSAYIDWLACLGVVPVLRRPRPRAGAERKLAAYLDGHEMIRNMATVAGMVERASPALFALARALDSAYVPEYDRVQLFYNFRRGEWRVRHAITGQSGECVVVWPPMWRGDRLMFDSPMQRLSHEVRECHSLREHSRLCRLINTAPTKVLLGRRAETDRGVASAARVVDRALGEDVEGKSGSAAARLVRLIINMKGMRHVGDINDTVRAYLDEAGGHLIDGGGVNQTLPGFGRSGTRPGGQQPSQLHQAFQASVVGGINNVLEGYVNNLFGTIERLRESNADLVRRLEARERELGQARASALHTEQRRADGLSARPDARVDCDVIDISNSMSDDAYVANSFQHHYVPSYAQDMERLSRLWETELLRCFKIFRLTNNQGHEAAIRYSEASVSLFVRPYFSAVLKAPHAGTPIGGIGAISGEEELWEAVFRRTRVQTYLADLGALFVAGVQQEVAREEQHNSRQRAPRHRSRSPPTTKPHDAEHHRRAHVPSERGR
ncbi:capsid portal protein UL6 [Leporid alphaherpesvirus 4]|uniref:Capsid portal protein UL6 n=1 Tax=Leporid alphaherpesvirus 4 TaxID=481315 RepID=J9R044_9ALPH|nr:capsid portal protein UL6 [Leporid alphaherpesvirus 4]AFR32447.1 capsid portal protein UL6 [Leporid alphaherpesvirus 4]